MASKNQGEGDRASARKYNEDTRDFVKSGEVDSKAEAAKKAVEGKEADKLKQAEKAGKAKAKETDPAVTRDHKSK